MPDMDPYVVKEYAQEMNRALATAQARIEHLETYIEELLLKVQSVHYEVGGKCMGCPKSMNPVDGVIYASYPCPTIQALE